MFLKQLEVMGFKSFAEKTVIEFVPGITAVVGPNGSGKSNIIDAVRWVLGEQSAKSLRGGKMEDVIFSGSDSRKSLNYAEVSLVLDNEDGALPLEYHEVSVTRRVYRTGESEFLINHHPCRLKDIIDLFMDSGLGKEAFSIISQGKVDEILNSKPEDRRSIFEEAAGVLKYKTRKKKAESKLQETTENLNRVADIIYELETQIEPLKIQASIAKDFLEKKEELEKLEVALTVHDIDVLHASWDKAISEIAQIGDQETQVSGEVQQLEAKLIKDKQGLAHLDQQLNDLQTSLLTVSEELEKVEGRREVLRERKKNATYNTEQLQKSIEEAKHKVASLQSEVELKKAELKAKEKEAEQIKSELQRKKQQMELLDGTIEMTIESLKGDYIEVLNEQASAKNERQYMEQQLLQLTQRSKRLEEENEKYLNQRNLAAQELTELVSKTDWLDKQMEEQITTYKKLKQEAERTKEQIGKQEELLYQAYHFVQQTKSRKESLELLEEEYSGFYQGVREVLKERNTSLHGIEGAVAELIQVPAGYETAIDTALGGSLQNIVVQTEKDARYAIEYLKRNRLGRATFLPLSIVKPKFLQPGQEATLKTHDAFVGIAADLIQYRSVHSAAIKSLLGNIVIAKNLKGANELAKLIQYRLRIVTMEGEVINPGGSMTGGAVKQANSSLLTRKNELENLRDKLADMEAKTADLEHKVKELKRESQQYEQRLEHERVKGERLRVELSDAQSSRKHAEMMERNVNERLALYDLEQKELRSESEVINDRIKELTSVLSTCSEEIDSLNRQITELTSKRDAERSSKETLNEEVSMLTSKSAVATEQLSTVKSELARLRKEQTDAEKKLTLLVNDLHWLDNEWVDHHASEEELAASAELKAQEKQALANELSSVKTRRHQLQQTLDVREADAKELKRQHQGITRMRTDLEVKKNRLEVELDNRLEKLREEYTLSYEGAKNMYALSCDPEEAREKVKLIKRGISELGSVNLGAIEEYERVNERYAFLNEQKADLLDAKKTLFDIMEEMDLEMKKRFSSTFSAIQAEFEGVFQALFGGGKAQLKLTNKEDLLMTGVDIVAQPPGKKLQNLSLLSGGERALTAIALLFSIIKIRPVPFCILDEVEAALDEANVQRFSDYLQSFSKETQFIVITHRQGTMQGADVLYGVTMQESGVSKLLSVKFSEKEMVQI